jgi:hypothetical protein
LIVAGLVFIHASSGQGISGDKIRLGGDLAFGSEIKNIGFNILGTYDIIDNIRIAPNFTFFLPSKDEFISWSQKTSMWELNIDVHYLLPVKADKIYIYPLAGFNTAFLTYTGTAKDSNLIGNPTFEYKNTNTDFGLNIGVGGDYHITDQLGALLELRYAISNFHQFVIKAGVAYRFK